MFSGCLLCFCMADFANLCTSSAKDMGFSGRTATFITCDKKLIMSLRRPGRDHISAVSGSYGSYGTSLQSPRREETFSNWTFSTAEWSCKVTLDLVFFLAAGRSDCAPKLPKVTNSLNSISSVWACELSKYGSDVLKKSYLTHFRMLH